MPGAEHSDQLEGGQRASRNNSDHDHRNPPANRYLLVNDVNFDHHNDHDANYDHHDHDHDHYYDHDANYDHYDDD